MCPKDEVSTYSSPTSFQVIKVEETQAFTVRCGHFNLTIKANNVGNGGVKHRPCYTILRSGVTLIPEHKRGVEGIELLEV